MQKNIVANPRKFKLPSSLLKGQNCVIEKNVEIGNSCVFGHNVVIHSGSRIGNNVCISDNTVIGKYPQRSKKSHFKSNENYKPAVIGNEVLIGANAVIYVGSIINDYVFIGDSAQVRENVEVGEYTIIG